MRLTHSWIMRTLRVWPTPPTERRRDDAFRQSAPSTFSADRPRRIEGSPKRFGRGRTSPHRSTGAQKPCRPPSRRERQQPNGDRETAWVAVAAEGLADG